MGPLAARLASATTVATALKFGISAFRMSVTSFIYSVQREVKISFSMCTCICTFLS